jgi:hypothetical protein
VDLERFFAPPPELAGDPGGYRSPLLFADGRQVTTAAEWRARRAEILATWHGILGAWPPLLEKPEVRVLAEEEAAGYTRRTVEVEVAPPAGAERQLVKGYLLVPRGGAGGAARKAPGGPRFPAVLVVYYDAETGAGLGRDGKEPAPHRDFAHQLALRGFVALSIGTAPCHYYPSREAASLQPLSALAYAAANCRAALAGLPEVDPARIGITGHSYGGKWAMFASALHEEFRCAAWSDGGIVFDEARANVNYWEPWYLGYERGAERQAGIPTKENPRTGAYRRLVEEGHDLHELHALMAPRPFLVSGGSEDRPERWKALHHSLAVNELLGLSKRVAMTSRPGHTPTPESNAELYAFFERFLKGAAEDGGTRAR